MSPASASCGSAFCTVNTNLVPQLRSPNRHPGRSALRIHRPNQPRHGNRNVAVGEIPRHHDEVQTINRNSILTIDHNFDANWGFRRSCR